MHWDILIKDLRKQMLVSQEELAKKLHVAFCTVNRYENKHFEPEYRVQREIKKLAIANDLDWDKYRKTN